jgi:hypothetical protein
MEQVQAQDSAASPVLAYSWLKLEDGVVLDVVLPLQLPIPSPYRR